MPPTQSVVQYKWNEWYIKRKKVIVLTWLWAWLQASHVQGHERTENSLPSSFDSKSLKISEFLFAAMSIEQIWSHYLVNGLVYSLAIAMNPLKNTIPLLYALFIHGTQCILCLVWFGLVWFYGISTIASYLMPNPVLYI